MKPENPYRQEAALITNYLLSTQVGPREEEIYEQAIKTFSISFSKYEQALWNTMLSGTFQMASIDAALALTDPNNNVRRKLYTMLAILEASPNYTSYFLSQNHSPFYLFKLIGVGFRAVFRALVGFMIVSVIKIKCS